MSFFFLKFVKKYTSFMGSRLRLKLVLIFILLSSVPVLILGGIALFITDLSHRHDVSQLELQAIDQKIEEMNAFFADTLDVIRLRVGITERTDVENQGIPWQEILARELMNENSAFEEISFINPQGREVAALSRIIDEPELADVRYLSKFQEALAGKDYISSVHYTLHGPMITLAAPVFVGERVIQVVSAEVNLAQIERSIETERIGTTGYLVLIDQNGALIAHKGKQNIAPGTDMSFFQRVRRVLNGELFNGLEPEDRYESFFGSTAVVGVGKKMSGVGWAILAEWPLADADAIILEIRSQILRLSVVIILSVILLAVLAANRVIQPVRVLEEGVMEIEKGNFEKQVEIATRDEFEELGGAFNKMAKGLKRLQELKNEFVFVAAHELRTPVTAIKGFLSMVREGDAGAISDTLNEYLDPIWTANERLVGLINNLLEIARSEAGKIKIEVAPGNIADAIRAILEEVHPLAKEKRISVFYEEKAPPPVLMDAARAKEVIMNFVSNAIKYNKEGGFVKVYHEVKDGIVVTHVEDNGFGMNAEDQKQLFQKFFRSEEKDVQEMQGTGLGLFITKELVEKMGGTIGVKSEKGKGSTFSFSLPRAS